MMVSIILPVYNGAQYLKECIESVLCQTFTDYELLILDDGSTDNSVAIAEAIGDDRIRVIRCQHDFVSTLNRGIAESSGEYLARIDCDDMMYPTRIEKQVDVMEKNATVAVCGTYAQAFGLSNHVFGYGMGEILNPLSILLLGNFVIHPSVMLRKSFLTTHVIHYKRYPYAEDFRLWVDISAAGGTFFIISEPLIKYRISECQVSIKHQADQAETSLVIRQEALDLLLRISEKQSVLPSALYSKMAELYQNGLVDSDDIFLLFSRIFSRMNKPNYSLQ